MTHNIGVVSVGHYVPDQVVSNHDLIARGLDTSDDWIVTRSGIQTRHVKSREQGTHDLATHAATMALRRAGVSANDMDMIIVATATPDHAGFPSTACLVQQALGITRPIPCMDLSAACSGFAYAIGVAYSKIMAGMGQHALVIGAESLSQVMDWSDRRSCILFGDGAGAAVVGPVASGGLLAFDEGADGHHAHILRIDPKPNTEDLQQTTIPYPRPVIHMDGPAVFKKGVQCVHQSIQALLNRSQRTAEDIDWFVAHQANRRILDAVASKLGVESHRFLSNIASVGNTSAASIPIVLSEFQHRLSPGDTLCLVGFGAGFTWSSILMEWSI